MSFMDRRAFLGRAALGVLASSSLGVVVPGEAKAAGGTRGLASSEVSPARQRA